MLIYFLFRKQSFRKARLTLKPKDIISIGTMPEKKGYSGTAVFTKIKPLNVTYGIGIDEHDKEGRVITLEFENFFYVRLMCLTLRLKTQGLNTE